MSKNRKYFPNKSVLLISTRTEEGMPLPPSHVVNAILWGILAEASERYDLDICHHLFMSNHLHMIVVVKNPAHVPAFMRYLKSESSHAVNRLLGRQRKTIWESGYDSPVLLSAERVIHYIKYLYLNPIAAKLVSKIDEYPGVSSWKMFKKQEYVSHHPRIPRTYLKRLESPALSVSEQRKILSRWSLRHLEAKAFRLRPWAWCECFEGCDSSEIRKRLIEEIAIAEDEYRTERRSRGETVVGVTALRRQSMRKYHVPESRSRRMIALCENKDIRKEFISFYKALCREATKVYQTWSRGDLSPRIPPGMFAPRIPLLCSALQL